MMKYFFLPLLLWFTLNACNSGQQRKTYRIGFSQCTGADEWRRYMLNEMNRELTFHPNYTLLYQDAGNSTDRQISQIHSLVDEGIDLLIVSPNETSTSITQAVESVFKKGIPVVVIDRKIETESYNAYIGADNVEIGRMAGAYIGNLLNGKGRIVEVWGLPGSSPAQERHRGLREALTRYPQVQISKELNGQWEKDTARRVAAAHLSDLKAADLVFTHNDVMGLGVYEVSKAAGLDKQLRFVGIDALPGPNAGMQFINEGILTASFLYPTGGQEAIETAVRILEGKSVKRDNMLNSIQVDASNIRALKAQTDKLLAQQYDIEKQSRRIDELTRTYSTQRNTLYLTLGSLVIVLVLGAWALYLVREKQAAYRKLEKQNAEILEQKDKIEAVSKQARLATEDKLRFYSYISHEFNTPLSLILTPTEDLLTKKNVSPHELKSSLSLVQKNAHRLLRLVNQMLDLRKTDAGKLVLKASEQDIVAFARDIVQDFRRKADKQRIDLQFITARPELMVWFDGEKLDKVLFNLLSNAFKYTPKGGLIHLLLDVRDNQVMIQVQDNGEGMTPEEQAHAFDLFFSGTKPFNLGNGLGLALSREFVSLHQGYIDVQSEKGKGTTFTMLLPLGNTHLAPEEMAGTPLAHTPMALPDIEEVPKKLVPASGRKGTLLVVEDHDDLRQFLVSRLSDEYEILAEPTGEKGWERILEAVPDLIISDIMLPGLDGLQLTQRTKTDFRTSHIPVILLTAKGQMEHRIEGTRAGADAYIAKPFNTTHLIETIRTTLANREKWQRRMNTDFVSQSGNRQEKKFLNELTALIEQNLTDNSYGVEQLSRDMGLSRVQLYRKVQALLDMTITDYFAQIRLKKAKYLLKESTRTMAEIAYEAGFSSPAYFTTFFKQHTQQTPSEYRRSPSVNA
ncbi:substrate-binding domain-containing protein [Nibrella saemangeumensis]|uniref:histidine kinase n=1 Tax=Nibrella saemangeumensis TaxID=1084526 RepID=A0ABP8NJL0_9BACT